MSAALSLGGCAADVEQGAGFEEDELEIEGTEQALSATHPWVARHGLTSAQYQSEFDNWVGKGYRLTYVSGYDQGGSARYAAVWEKTSGPGWQAKHGLTASQYQSTVDSMKAAGYHPVLVNGYSVGGTPYFAAIFHNDAVAWVARHNLTPSQYQAEFNTWVGQGYRLRHVSGYTSGGTELYAAIFDKSSSPAWQARHGLSSSDYQSAVNTLSSQGYEPVLVNGYFVGSTPKYAAIFQKRPTRWSARHGVTGAGYQQFVLDSMYEGSRPVMVSGYSDGSNVRFATIWNSIAWNGADLDYINDTVTSAMSSSGTVGLSLAITRNGKLVFAKGYGTADESTNAAVDSSSRFRIASNSKQLTSIAIMKLIQAGSVRLTDRVFGKGALLGETYALESELADSRIKNITVQHLLEHTAGGWDNSSGVTGYQQAADGTGDPMFSNTNLTQAQLISWVLKNQALEYNPGTRYQYSNFGYCVLGRIIERISGKSYSAYMKDNVFTPSGATSFAIGGNTLAARLSNEPVYYSVGGSDNAPYANSNMARMDSHGGWVASPIDVLRVVVRADGFASVPDMLSPTSVTTMTTRSTAQVWTSNGLVQSSYARGWMVNNVPNWWHTGYLTGESSELLRTAALYGPSGTDAFNVFVVTNSNHADLASTPNFDEKSLDINEDDLAWDIINGVSSWPAFDLF